jgi:hypothetical protein
MGGSNKAPEPPKQKKETYSSGFGDTATQDSFTPSDYNLSQMNWVQSVTPQLQSKLYDSSGADSQARAYADNIKSQGLKSFKLNQADSLGAIQADNARRFGSLSNSDYDTNLKTMIRENNSALEDINAQYDMNYQNALNNYQNYYNNLLSTASGVGANLYNLGSGLSQNAFNSSNATNNFNQQNYQNQLAQYNQQQAQNNAMWGAGSRGLSMLGGGYLSTL